MQHKAMKVLELKSGNKPIIQLLLISNAVKHFVCLLSCQPDFITLPKTPHPCDSHLPLKQKWPSFVITSLLDF